MDSAIITRQHPQGGGREALSNPVWFIFIINVQYEYNWIRLRQLTYLVRSQKRIKNGTLEPGISALKSVSGGPFFWTFADLAGRRRAAAAAGGRWLLVGQRNVIGASRKNIVFQRF